MSRHSVGQHGWEDPSMPPSDFEAKPDKEWLEEQNNKQIKQQAVEIKRLQGALETIRTASEFHAQNGVSDHVMRYAHESNKRLCDSILDMSDNREGGDT